MKNLEKLLLSASMALFISPIEPVSSRPAYCNNTENLPPIKKEICEKGIGRKKVVDQASGLSFINIPNDDSWDTRLKVDAPFSSLVKITSSFDGEDEYAVYDNFYNRKNCEFPFTCYRAGVITKWTPEYLSGVNYLVKTATEPLLSPIDIKHLGKTYTLYGEEGKFILPNPLIESIKSEKIHLS